MAATKNIETKLVAYLKYLSDKKKMAVLTLAKNLAEEEEEKQTNTFSDEQIKDFDGRWHKFLKDKTNVFSWDEVKAEALIKII